MASEQNLHARDLSIAAETRASGKMPITISGQGWHQSFGTLNVAPRDQDTAVLGIRCQDDRNRARMVVSATRHGYRKIGARIRPERVEVAPPMTKDVHHARRQKAVDLIARAGIDVLAIVPGPNFHYLTGLDFHLMERPTVLLLSRTGEVSGIIPALETLKWSGSFPHAETFYWQDSDGYDDAFSAAGQALGQVSVGVEGGRMRMFESDALRRHVPDGDIINADHVLARLRMAKDDVEIAAMEKAIFISELVLEETLQGVRAGDTEREVQTRLKACMLSHDVDGFAFEPIVLAGGNAANPHGTPGTTALQPGDVMLIDFGASVDGYNADITRTVFVGHATDEHAAIYETVLSANARGRAIAGPDVTCHDLDVAVTDVLRESPFEDLIVHKTGHGLGLDVHEAPQVMVGNDQPLIPGAVITIEPGLYRAGDIGVRIEDDVLITEDGSRSLTEFGRGLRTVG